MTLHLTISGQRVTVEVDEARYRAAIRRLAAVLSQDGRGEKIAK